MRAASILIIVGLYFALICAVAYKGAQMVKDFNDSMIKQSEELEAYENR